MDLIINILGILLKIIVIYGAVIGIFCIFPVKKYKKSEPKTKFAVLLPARNEENVIAHTVKCLKKQNYPQELFDIYVIPNNCADNTEAEAACAGALIIRCETEIKCKGDALRETFEKLAGKYDAYCIFDSDNIVDGEFLSEMNNAVLSGAMAAKGHHTASNPYSSWVSGCYELYFENLHVLYNRPRSFLGLSAKLNGTGFMVTEELMQKLGGWNTETIAEDAEFSAICAEHNVKIHYVSKAVTYDEQPESFRQSLRQRHRWSCGLLRVANIHIPKLLSSRASMLTLDSAVLISMIYTQIFAVIPVLYGMIGQSVSALLYSLFISVAGFIVTMTGQAVIMCIISRKNIIKMLPSIILYPFFTVSWYPLHFVALFTRKCKWKPIYHRGCEKLQK